MKIVSCRRTGIAIAAALVLLGQPAVVAAAPPERTDAPPVLPPTASITTPIALYLGYYDTHHPGLTRPKPDPWNGSTGVVFVGESDPDGGWDSACLRIDNLTDDDLDAVSVTVDIGAAHYALWDSHTIPERGKLILAQTEFENFDGSDTNAAGCYSCSPSDCLSKVSSAVPLVTVRIPGATFRYYDKKQVLNTRGVDGAGCPYTGSRNDESQDWTFLSASSAVVAGLGGAIRDSISLPAPTLVEFDAPVPNPARGSVMFRFSMPVAGSVDLGVYDVAGRRVRSCLDGGYEAGTYVKGLDLTGVQPGVYFGILRAPGGVAKRAFTVVR